MVKREREKKESNHHQKRPTDDDEDKCVFQKSYFGCYERKEWSIIRVIMMMMMIVTMICILPSILDVKFLSDPHIMTWMDPDDEYAYDHWDHQMEILVVFSGHNLKCQSDFWSERQMFPNNLPVALRAGKNDHFHFPLLTSDCHVCHNLQHNTIKISHVIIIHSFKHYMMIVSKTRIRKWEEEEEVMRIMKKRENSFVIITHKKTIQQIYH